MRTRMMRKGVRDVVLAALTAVILANALPLQAACPAFTQQGTKPAAGTQPFTIAVADFNVDGKMDFVVANEGGNNVSVLLGNGNGTFAARVNYAASGADGVAVGDFNGDGKPDLVIAGSGLFVRMNTGAGAFGAATTYTSSFYTSVAVGDLNGDGKPDIVAANYSANQMAVFLNNGTGTFSGPVTYAADANPFSIAVGDVNGDGKVDVVVANRGSNDVSLFLGNGNGTFGAGTNYAAGTAPNGVAIADLNGDGKGDVIVANHDSEDISVLLGTASGLAGAVSNPTGANLYAVTTGDFNGDGKLDVASVSADANNGYILLGTGTATLGAVSSYSTGSSSTTCDGIGAADFDGDGKLDFALANYGTNNVSIFLNSCAASPSITQVAPVAGPTGGGQTVTITGTSLTGATSVKFASSSATITGNTATSITVTSPAHAAGTVNVSVTNPGGTATATNAYTYVAAPTITSVSPNSGPIAGSQSVTISGTNLANATSVTFGGTAATIGTNTTGSIIVTTPGHASGAVNVVVTTAGGTATSTNGYTYVDPPTAGAATPNSGPTAGGQSVVVAGTNLSLTSSVTIGGTTSTITGKTATTVTVNTPAHAAGLVDIVVTTPGGTATSTGAYTYVAAPSITSVTPNAGPATGGQTGVVISGTVLSNATSVTFGGTAATITNNTATTITVTTPAHAAGAVNVVVTTAGGSATSTNGYTYVAAPTATTVAPNNGPAAGGQTGVVISGTVLSSATSVTFGGTAATITNNTVTAITVTTPPHVAGAVDVVVTTAGGTATVSNGYTYVDAPTTTTVAPSAGPAAGGQTGVVISGTVLSNATGVTFGGTAATITNNTATAVTVTTPAHAAGSVNVVVTTVGGTATVTNGYTYITAPTASTVSPNAGPAAGGQTGVVISGSNLSSVTSVTFGGAPATITNNTGSAITVTTPPHAGGAVDVVVTSAGGSATITSGYTYVPAPAITSVSPNSGPVTGGQTVVLSGTDLGNATGVTFGGTPATITNNTSGSITVTTPVHTIGPVSVDVTTVGGSGSSAYTYVAGSAVRFTVSAPPSATAGVAFSVTVTALDAFDNVATGYLGTVHFTSSDGTATLPPDSTLTNGTGTFSATLRTVGSQTITATDGGITGTSNAINVGAGTATHFALSAPASATAGVPFTFTVTALDAFNNTASGYAGTMHFTSSDGTATLTPDSSLTSGLGTFNATLNIAGIQTIGAADGPIIGTSNSINVAPAAATHFVLSAPATATAGVTFTFTVTALDAFNNTATGYAGAAHFTSNDGSATLPVDSTLTSGSGTFNATLRLAGSRTVAATDGSITGTSNTITVAPAGAIHFTVSAPASATAGGAFTFTVTALDAFNNTATGYLGTIHFTSSDGAPSLPPNSTLTSGTGTFSATLRTAGTQTITATDGSISGTSNPINVAPAAATHFVLSAPASATAGVAFTFTVTALDAFNNTATGYAGTAHFTSSDGTATMPPDSTLSAGFATFNATLRIAGPQTISAADGPITGTSNTVNVTPAGATHFTLSAPPSATAGVVFTFTVTALDAFNNTATGYVGTVHFTSSEATATLPGDSTLTNGTGPFNATLHLAGGQTITGADGPIAGTSNTINVAPAAATHFTLSAPASATAGVAFTFTVTALDAFNNTATAYAGNAHFTSSDGTATLPPNSTLTSGVGTLSATLRTAGAQTLTATDGPITGTSNTITVGGAATTHFTVSAPASATAGGAFTFTVTALDAFNNTATGYLGTIHFTSSDGAPTLPPNSTLTNGTGSFSATLRTAGAQTLTATDGPISGTSNTINVAPAAATHFALSAPTSATAGVAFTFTVTALDTFDNTATGYAGTAHFTSSDGTSTLPPDNTLTNGIATFSATLRTAGAQTITAADGPITGTSNNINVTPAAATHFTLSAPPSATAGVAFTFTITALDAFNNTANGYDGMVHFTSSEGTATLPGDSTLTNGTGSLNATLHLAGGQTIAAADGPIAGTSNVISIAPAAATHFTLSAPASATAGVAFTFTVTALDSFNNIATTYVGTAHFTSSDTTATLPPNSPLTNGTATFNATLRTAGAQTLTATDGPITGTSNTITVGGAATTHFTVSAPASATASGAFTFTVTALDAFNNTATGYLGTIHFTSSDGAPTLPPNSTLTNGAGTFSATLRTAGAQTITATDGSISGTSNTINVAPAAATHFVVSAPASSTAGVSLTFTVTALDAFNNTATGYAGNAHFTSSDGTATLPPDSTLTNGIATFSATLRIASVQTISATDGPITGTSNTVNVAPAAATHFALSAPASATAGVAFTFTITARDAFNNTATGYIGTVHFTSSEGTATLPGDSTLTNGTGSLNATLRLVGGQTITGTDGPIAGTSNSINVAPAAATHFVLSAPASATAGVTFTFTVTALDAFNNTATAYAGNAHFTSSDTTATLPPNSPLTNGAATFNATLRTAGAQTLTATDGAISGTSNTVNVAPASAKRFDVTAPGTATAGTGFAFTVTARDAFNNVATGYAGTLHFTSGDGTATLPADSSLTSGTSAFNATLRTAGSQSLTATDASLTGSTAIGVSAAPADHFVIGSGGGGNIPPEVAGTPFMILATARDLFGNVDTAFQGVATLTTNAGSITPSSISYAGADAGVKSVSVTVTEMGSGKTITATAKSVTGTSAPFVVDGGPLDHFRVEASGGGAIGAQTANVPFAIRVTALDANDNVTLGFSGTVAITSTGILLAGGGTTAAFTNGVLATHGVSIGSVGSMTITATNGASHGTSNAFAVGASADVALTLSGSSSIAAGSQATYTLVVTNNGPSVAHSPALSLTLPANWALLYTTTPCGGFPCTLPDLAPGASVTLQLAVSAPSGSAASVPYDVTVAGSSSTPDPAPANNQATAHTSVSTVACASIPTGLQPDGGTALAASGALRWNASGADSYVIDFGPEGSGCSTIVMETSGTSFDYHGLVPGQRYEWRVIAKHAGCPPAPSACMTFTATDDCVKPAAILLGSVAEISSGATYHVTWNDAGAAGYELQEATDAGFANAQTIPATGQSAQFRHDASVTTSYYYRVRPIVPCLGQLPYAGPVRVVVQPRVADDQHVLNLMVENGSADILSQTAHLDAPAGAFNATTTSAGSTYVALSDEPWLVVSPVSGTIPPSGVNVTLSVNAAGRLIGTSVATVHLATTDGVTLADMRVNLNVGAMMTSQPRGTPIPANAAILPAVAHAPGVNALWQSDVRLFNPSSSSSTYALSFTPSATDGTESGSRVDVTLPAGATVAFDDVVRHLFGMGAFGSESAIGSLEVRPQTAEGRAVVTSRTYAVTPAGTYGQAIPAFNGPSFASFGTTLSLQHLAQSDAYRTNVGLIEGSGHDATAHLRVYDASGAELTHFDVSLGRLEQRQFNSMLADHGVTAIDNARIEVEVTSPNALLGAYASVVDNRTADPTLVPAVNPSLVSASRYVVPGVADFTTGRNTWRTDVRIFNASNASVTANLIFFPQGSNTTLTKSVTIAPREVKAFDSVLRSLFTTSDVGGALHVVTPTLTSLVISARTYDDQTDGTYGQFIPAVTSPEATGLGDRALEILQLEQSAAYRANVGFVEVAGNAAHVEVTATLADGRTAVTQLDLAPYEFRQIGSMLQSLGFDTATNARLTLRVTGGSGRVTGYASIIDNRTGDPTYMPAQ